jgi:hypothetical protein
MSSRQAMVTVRLDLVPACVTTCSSGAHSRNPPSAGRGQTAARQTVADLLTKILRRPRRLKRHKIHFILGESARGSVLLRIVACMQLTVPIRF